MSKILHKEFTKVTLEEYIYAKNFLILFTEGRIEIKKHYNCPSSQTVKSWFHLTTSNIIYNTDALQPVATPLWHFKDPKSSGETN